MAPVNETVPQPLPDLSPEFDAALELPEDPSQVRHLHAFVRATSLLAISTGGLVLAGWAYGISLLIRVAPGFAPMKPNTAVGFLVSGIAMWLVQDAPEKITPRARWAVALSAFVVAVGAATLFEHMSGGDIGIDRLLFRSAVLAAGGAYPGRISIATSAGLAMLAVSLLLVVIGRSWVVTRQTLAILVVLDALIGTVGYLYGVDELYRVQPFSSMAVHTAVLLTLMGAGSLALVPRAGVMRVLTSELLGGAMARRVLPLSLLVPPALGWLRWKGELAGYYGTSFGLALFTLSNMVLLTALLMVNAASINRMDERQKRAEASDLRLAAIVESSLDPIVGKDLNGIVTSWNGAAGHLFGYSAAEMIGQSVRRLIPPDRLHEEERIMRGIRHGERIESFETVRLRKDGTALDVAVTISPVLDARGRVIGASKIARDITGRKRLEDAVRQSQDSLRGIVQSAMDAIISIDEGQRVVMLNPAAAAMFGYSTEQALGKPLEDFIPARYRRAHGEHVRQFAETGVTARAMGKLATLSALRADGTEFPIEASISQVAIGSRKLFTVILRDVTERCEAAEELQRRAEELARSNRDLEQFAYAASHDLQEPLRAVAGCVQLLQSHYEGKFDARGNEFITHAVDGATRMQKLIDDLLTFSRVGTRGVEFTSIKCAEAVENALRNLSVAIREQNASVEYGELPVVAGDLSQLSLLFQNLIGNALKFRGGDAPRIRVAARREGREWVLCVRDNGIGIAPQYFERVFVMFQRLHTRREYPGTGMGLALCKRIVERHGGRIWVESEAGKGATFCFTLKPWTDAATPLIESHE